MRYSTLLQLIFLRFMSENSIQDSSYSCLFDNRLENSHCYVIFITSEVVSHYNCTLPIQDGEDISSCKVKLSETFS